MRGFLYFCAMKLLILIICLASLSGCAVFRKAVPTQPYIVEKIIEKDTTIYLPSAVIRDTTRIYYNTKDSVFTTFERVIHDKTNSTTLSIYLDKLGRLTALCERKADTIYLPIKETHTISVAPPLQPEEPIDYVKWGALAAVVLLGVILVLKK
jgi:hypothetical protein